MFGRPFKSLENGVFVALTVRWILFFLAAVVASASLHSPYDGMGVALIAALDAASVHTTTTGQYFAVTLQNKLWIDQLTDRIFVKLAVEHIRNGTANALDVDDLYNVATKEALADVKRAADGTEIFGPSWPKTARFFAVLARTIGALVSYGLYYGAAIGLGSVLK